MNFISSIFANLIDKYIKRGFAFLISWFRFKKKKEEVQNIITNEHDEVVNARVALSLIESTINQVLEPTPEMLDQLAKAKQRLRDANNRLNNT